MISLKGKTETTKLFEEITDIPGCNEFTQSYLIDIFNRYISQNVDLSKISLTLLYKEAIEKGKFEALQNIGDWLIYTKSIFPESLKGASLDYYESLGSMSYYKCYLIMKRQWKVYEELADQFSYYTDMIQRSVQIQRQNGILAI